MALSFIRRSLPVGLGLFLFLGLLALPSLPPTQSQYDKVPQILPVISAGAISQKHSFVIACNGESFLYNPSAGILGVPFLQNVYKPFGFSYDSQFFLYLKANGRFPTFSLYSYNLTEGTEKLITTEPVYNAAWSPVSLKIAFIVIQSATHFHLWVYDGLSGSAQKIFSGWLNPDFLEWSPDGQKVLYISQTPLTDNYFYEGIFEYFLHEYDLSSGTERTITDTIWAEYYRGELLYLDQAGLLSSSEYRPAKTRRIFVSDTNVVNFKINGDDVYLTQFLDEQTVVGRYNIASGSYKLVDRGEIYGAIEEGLVIREFTGEGVVYKYLDYGSNSSTEIYAFSQSWKLPYASKVTLTQGGSGYRGAQCDGKACCLSNQRGVCDHTGVMAYALDFQQRRDRGQGNEHILAVADGTVADLANDVKCNSCDRDCDGWDKYDESTCRNPSGPSYGPYGGAGNYIVIAHSDQSFSLYAHLKSDSIQVSKEQQVCQGFYLADQGHTGCTNGEYNTCGDHLHFERVSSINLNRDRWTRPVGRSQPIDFVDVDCNDIKTRGCLAEYSSQNIEVASCGSGSAPDLVVTALSDPPSTVAQGGNFTVSDTTKNIGTGVAGFSTTRYRLSRDNIITTADPLLTGGRSVPSLSPDEESTGSVTVTVPTTIPPGTYYLGACADDLKAVSEANEANNCRASTTRVQVMRVAGRTFDYTLSNSGDITVTQGGSGSTTITRTLVSGTPQPVSLSVTSGLPPGAAASFTNNPCTPTCSSTLTISTSASTPTGTFPITVTGSPGGKTTSFNLIVTAPRLYTLTVYKQGTGSGTVTATGCTLTWSGNTGTCTAASGTPITLRAQADAGSIFSGWEGIIGSASGCSGTGPCTFTLTEDSSVAAVFTSITDTTFLHFYDVTYGNGRFVAVGDWGMSVTSPDGVTWTVRASGVPRALRGVTYGNGRFVAVGDGVILTSPDGVTWTKRGSGTYVLYGVTYGNGRFVAVGGNGVILTSPDGVTWTMGASGTDDWLLAVTYGNGLFVAVGIRIGDRDGPGIAGAILTSADGVTWTVRPSWRGNYLQGVNYVNGLFIAVGGFSYGLSPILTSADGVTWMLRWHDRPSPLHDVTYGNGRFVAVGDWGMSVTSADGVTWRMEGFSGIHGHGVTYGNGLFVAVGSTTVESAGAIVTSPDGVTWTRRPLGTTP
jgi:hypothetical protein